MKYEVYFPLQRIHLMHDIIFREVEFEHGEMWVIEQFTDVLPLSGGHVVQANNRDIAFEQRGTQMRANKARTTTDKSVFQAQEIPS